MIQHRLSAAVVVMLALAVATCQTKQATTSIVPKSVGTLVLTSGVAVACGGALAPDPVSWYDTMQAARKLYQYAGFELFKAPMCTQARLDAYRGITRFEFSPIANLKGLIQSAQLIVETRMGPAGSGGVATFPGTINVTCPAVLGGGGALQRFPPAAQGTTANYVKQDGVLTDVTPTGAFPTATLVYTFPATLTTSGTTPQQVAGASSPTTVSPTGTGGVIFSTDVTGVVNAALNSNATEVTYMLTALFEGPVPGALPTGSGLDCKTGYDIELRVTHF